MLDAKMVNVKKYVYDLVFVFIFVLQVYLIFYYSAAKPDFYIDEYYSFNFANSNFAPLLRGEFNLFNCWIGSDYWHKLLTVQPDQTFNYASVYYNTAKDVHPPFYYFLVHTLYSFFPDVWNPNFALLLNIVFFLGTQIFIYKIMQEIVKNDLCALFTCCTYGFSIAAINTFVLIRMYGLLTFLTIFYIWLMIKNENSTNRIWLFGIAIVNIIGFLTHYFFLVYATFVFCVFFYRLYRNKEFSKCFALLCVNIVSLVISVICFPECLDQILGHGGNSYRGEQAINGFLSIHNLESYILNCKNILIYNVDVFAIALLLIISGIVYSLIYNNSNKETNLYDNYYDLAKQLLVMIVGLI